MKIKLMIAFALIGFFLLVNSCENKQAMLPQSLSGCDTSGLKYSSGTNNMKPIIDAQCGVGDHACHAPGGTSGYDYTRFSVIYGNYTNGSLYSALFQGVPSLMPKVQQAGWRDSSACMSAKFKQWIKIGCPQ